MKKFVYIVFFSLIMCTQFIHATRVTINNTTSSAVRLRMKINAHFRELIIEKGETYNDFPDNGEYELCLVKEVEKMMSTGAPMLKVEEFACKRISNNLVKNLKEYGFKIVEYSSPGPQGPIFTYEIQGPIEQ